MRILALPIQDDLLEVHNSLWTGEEKVYFNGQLASSGYSIFGRSHYFTVDAADGQGVDKYRVEIGMNWWGSVTVDVFRNDRCLLASSKTPVSRVDPRTLPDNEAKPYHITRDGGKPELDEEFFV
ncbi:hypothetical protein CLV84_4141 [Neolewinella xylanilytica]|uniref:Uncharacterized protein n=1 Tax=Neolewinella xylanilytica TaxID=1514080 RepID=A0A2S6I0I5_9BACT|nr:hypothetical protein [Neolewinella xylanilytica]PPK84371.1 hypothetical protein CLV84_4141 [Neolewinella xylanilytica]